MDVNNLFCICRTKYDERLFMIECFACKDWFHGKCIGISDKEAELIEEYYCSSCQGIHGPMKLKSSVSKQSCKPDEFELIDHVAIKNFYQALDDSLFLDSSQVVTYIATGTSLTPEYIYDNGLSKPVVIGKPEGLGLIVPQILSSKHLESYLGSSHIVNLYDILENEERMIKLAEWTSHFDNDQSLGNISIVDRVDITGSKLLRLIKIPKIIKQLDLVETSWPKSDANEDFLFERPKTSLFLSMGDSASFTDFHVGMSGGSVWYYNITGSRTFYLVPPNEENLKIFEDRGKINNLDHRFFGDLADACYKLVTRENETTIIPGGWMFASYVNEKSISLTGQFCDIFNLKHHIACYEMQKRLKSLNTIRFPHFEVLVWCAAETMQEILCSNHFKYSKSGIVESAKILVTILRKWISKKEEHLHAQEIPPHINPTKLINSITYAIGKINRVNSQRVSPLKIRTKPGSSKQMKCPTTSGASSGEEEQTGPPHEAKISIKFNKSLLYAGQNNSAEANVSPGPIKLRLPKIVLNEISPPDGITDHEKQFIAKSSDDTSTTKSGRKRKRPKTLSGFVDTSSNTTVLYYDSDDDEITKNAKILSTCGVEKPEISKIRERLQKTPKTAPVTPLSSTRKKRNVYNEESSDESESYLSRCKQDAFYVYPTIKSNNPSRRHDGDEEYGMDTNHIKLKVRLPINKSESIPVESRSAVNINKTPILNKNKKGMSTPKQRLGKLLKIDKSFMRR